MSDRQQFEEWIKSMDRVLASNDGLTLTKIKGRYEQLSVELAWQGWLESKMRNEP